MRLEDSSSQSTSKGDSRRRKRGGVKPWIDGLWGFDAFIAHRRVDGQDYAKELYGILTDKGVDCFIDTEVYLPGDSLNVATKRNVSKSTVLVVVGSPEVYRKPTPTSGRIGTDWVKEEIDTYRRANPDDPKIILLNFGGAYERSESHPIAQSLADILWMPLEAESLSRTPNSAVVSAVTSQLDGRRRDKSRLRVFRAATGILATLLVGVGLLSLVAQRNADEASDRAVEAEDRQVEAGIQTMLAEQNGARAETNEVRAVTNEAEAIRQAGLAEQNLELALQNLKESARQGMDVKRNRRDSQRNAAEALRQQGIAEENLTLARINEELARQNEALALRNLATATSRELAALAVTESGERPWLALLLAVDSWFASPLGLEPGSRTALVANGDSEAEQRTLESRNALATALVRFVEAPLRPLDPPDVDLDDPLGATTVSRNGELIAYPGSDQSIHIERLDTGQPVGVPIPFEGRVQSLAFDLEGKTLAVVVFELEVTLDIWDIESATHERVATRGAARACTSPLDPVCLFVSNSEVQFSPDGTELVALMDPVTSSAEILVWDLSDLAAGPAPLNLASNGVEVPSDFDLSPVRNGGYTIGVASAHGGSEGPGGAWSLWEGDSLELIRVEEDFNVSGIEFDPAGIGSFVISSFNNVERRDVGGDLVGERLFIPFDFASTPWISHIGFSPGGLALAATFGSAETGFQPDAAVIWLGSSSDSPVPAIPLPADGPIIATLFRSGDELLSIGSDGSLALWDFSDKTQHETPGIRSFVDAPILESIAVGRQSVAYSSGSPLYVPEAIVVRNMATGSGQRLRGSADMSELVIADDDSALVARSSSGGLFRWDLRDGLDAEPQALPFENAVFDSNLRRALEITPGGVSARSWPDWAQTDSLDVSLIRDLTSRELRDSSPIQADPELRRLAVSGGFGTVHIIDVNTGRATAEFSVPVRGDIQPHAGRITELSWSPGGRYVAARSDLGFSIWRAGSGDLLRLLPPQITELTFSPDGTYYATAGPDGVQLWDLITGDGLGSTWGGDSFSRIHVSADGRTLLLGHSTVFGVAWPVLQVLPGLHPAEACRAGLPGGEVSFRDLQGLPSVCSDFFG